MRGSPTIRYAPHEGQIGGHVYLPSRTSLQSVGTPLAGNSFDTNDIGYSHSHYLGRRLAVCRGFFPTGRDAPPGAELPEPALEPALEPDLEPAREPCPESDFERGVDDPSDRARRGVSPPALSDEPPNACFLRPLFRPAAPEPPSPACPPGRGDLRFFFGACSLTGNHATPEGVWAPVIRSTSALVASR